MSKYDKMVERNHQQSKEKINRAKAAIWNMLEEGDKVTIPKLIRNTGLSRGFFYKNPEVRREIDKALQKQAGMVDNRKRVLDMAMDNRIMQLEQTIENYRERRKNYRKKMRQCERL